MYITKAQNFALYLFLFSLNFEVWDPLNTNGSFSLAKLTGFIYLITIIPDIKFFVRLDSISKLLLPLGLFFALLTLIGALNVNIVSSSFFNPTIFFNIIFFWFLINHELKQYKILGKGMLFFALGSVISTILYLLGIGVVYEQGRLILFNENENYIGIRICISILILLAALVQNNLKLGSIRYFMLIPLPFMMYLMAETGSRLAFIAFSLALLTGVILLKTKGILGKIVEIASGLIIFIIVFIWLIQTNILKQRLLQSAESGDLAGRDVIWQSLIPLIKGNPILGVGETGYEYFSQSTFGMFRSPHNVFLEVLCFTGIAGLVLFLLFLFRVSKFAISSYTRKGWILPVILLIPILGMLLSSHILTKKTGWIILAYIVSSNSIKYHYSKHLPLKMNDNSDLKTKNIISEGLEI